VLVGCASAASLVALNVLAHTDDAGVSRVAGHPVLTVLSNSMTPTFRAGDVVVDRSADGPKQLGVGDVITFRASQGSHALITHRIVAVEPDPLTGVAFRTQGDANNAPDGETVSPEQVVGVYSTRIPYAGYALQAAHSRWGLFLLISVPLLLWLGPVFKTWWRASDAGSPPGRPGPAQEAPTTLTETVTAGDHRGGGTHQA
jgi:signal peptidase